jgi:lipoprotein-anchoring transpeptidase ErfK/SrfK
MKQPKGQDVPVNTGVNHGGSGTRFVVVLLAMAGLGLAATVAGANGPAPRPARAEAAAAVHALPASGSAGASAMPAAQEVLPAAAPLTPAPTPPLLQQGDTGPRVRVLQARLRQLGWYAGKVTGRYRASTTRAVEGFQQRHALPVVGSVDRDTMQRLRALTRKPTRDELANRTVAGQGGGGTWTTSPLDPRCRTGRVLCVDKSSRTIRWVVRGEVRKTMAVRFGAAYTPTREGVFHVGWKSRDHVSTLFHTAMPFAMFFSGGQAVHYSSDFAARGYSGASHGCVNVRDYDGIRWLFDRVRVGDKVVVSWS